MSLLSKRVQKSKFLKFNFIPGATRVAYGTISPDSGNHYQIFLMKIRESSQFGDDQVGHDTIITECHCNTGNGKVAGCKGNSQHTICYHCLGAIRHHLSLKDVAISFYQNIFDATKLRKNRDKDSLVKIVSGQGRGIIWGVVSKKSAVKEQVYWQELTNILRGTVDEQNGID